MCGEQPNLKFNGLFLALVRDIMSWEDRNKFYGTDTLYGGFMVFYNLSRQRYIMRSFYGHILMAGGRVHGFKISMEKTQCAIDNIIGQQDTDQQVCRELIKECIETIPLKTKHTLIKLNCSSVQDQNLVHRILELMVSAIKNMYHD